MKKVYRERFRECGNHLLTGFGDGIDVVFSEVNSVKEGNCWLEALQSSC